MAASTITYNCPAIFRKPDTIDNDDVLKISQFESEQKAKIDSGEISLTVDRLAVYVCGSLSCMVSGISFSQRFVDMLWEKHITVEAGSTEAVGASVKVDHDYNVIFYINGDEAYSEYDALLDAYGDTPIPALTLYNRFIERYGSIPCRCNKCRDAF